MTETQTTTPYWARPTGPQGLRFSTDDLYRFSGKPKYFWSRQCRLGYLKAYRTTTSPNSEWVVYEEDLQAWVRDHPRVDVGALRVDLG